MPNIVIKSKFRKFIDKERVHKSIIAVLNSTNNDKLPNLTVKISDEREIQGLNKIYRGIDVPTDVLSFNNEYLDLENGSYYLGDVIISYPTAKAQANKAGHHLSDEIELLIVHGCLHLLGHDHAGLTDKQEMWKIQRTILSALGNPLADEEDFT